MTEEEHQDLTAQVRQVADMMGLKDWTFTVQMEPCENENAFAAIFPAPGKKHADIQVCADWNGASSERRQYSIIHELVHCHLVGATDVIRLDLEAAGVLTDAQHDWLWASFQRQIEYATDSLAQVIARQMFS